MGKAAPEAVWLVVFEEEVSAAADGLFMDETRAGI